MKPQIKKTKLPPPRNPYVAAARFKKAGSHQKPGKALRRSGKMEDQRALENLHRHRSDDQRMLDLAWMDQNIDTSDRTFLSVF